MEGFSIRSILTFVLVVVVTAFLWATAGLSTPVNAAEATWSGDSLSYENNQYIKTGTSQGTESHKIPKDSVYYTYAEKSASGTRHEQKVFIIYFAAGASPPTETTATLRKYDYNSSTKVFSNPSNPETITIDLSISSEGTSCDIDGIGWFACPIGNNLAKGMDQIFNILDGFMEVQPVQVNDTGNGMYIAWDIMRNIANVAFIIAFLVLIYSQMTSYGMSNYGLKKLIPRLIVGAILVNLSFIICAVAVDISNILGYALQDVFMQIRDTIFQRHVESSAALTSWESIMGLVLSGGTLAAAGGIGLASTLVATGGTLTGLFYIILPALVGLIMTVLVVVLVLAARQAIITIFIIIAPLAFVAYLLPNTEKWFTKWREVFMTMLIFFPAFSVVFGGSQLAGAVIIQNATSINVVILGMIVQVAPLVITPLLLKFSGNLLGKIAGIVNNPSKGLLDRTRKWSDGQREYHKNRGISGMNRKFVSKNPDAKKYNPKRYIGKFEDTPGELAKKNWVRRSARVIDGRRRDLEGRTKNVGALADNNYHRTSGYKKIHETAYGLGQEKTIIDNEHETHLKNATATPGTRLYNQNLRLEHGKRALEMSGAKVEQSIANVLKDEKSTLHELNVKVERTKAELAKTNDEISARISEYNTGRALNVEAHLTADVTAMAKNALDHAMVKQSASSTQYVQQKVIAEAVSANDARAAELLQVAQGVDTENGAQRALANAISTLSSAKETTLKNIETIIKYKNPTRDEILELANGNSVKGIASSVDVQTAAAKLIFSSGNGKAIVKAYKDLDLSFPGMSREDAEDMRVTIAETLEANKTMPTYLTYALTDKLRKGERADGLRFDDPGNGRYQESGTDDIFLGAINSGAVDAGSFVDTFNDYIKEINEVVDRHLDDPSKLTPEGRAKLEEAIRLAFDRNGQVYHKLGGKRDTLKSIAQRMGIPDDVINPQA